MPRCFGITDAGHPTEDLRGSDRADDREARDEAVALLTDMARGELPDGDQHESRVTVQNEADVVVYEASLRLNGRWWPGRR